MTLLLDTQLLLWAMNDPDRLPRAARALLTAEANTLLFSPASLWEVAIKNRLRRDDFQVDPRVLRRGLLDSGYAELPITSEHAINVGTLPALHRDPFDRILLAQAHTEGITLVTVDAQVARYPGSVHKV